MVLVDWFLGYDVILKIVFAIITFVVAMFGFKIHRVTSQKQPYYLAWAFLLISISNIIQSIFNFMIIEELNESIHGAIEIQSISLFNAIGTYTHMILMLVGLSLLVFMTFKTENKKGFFVISSLALVPVLFSRDPIHMFYAITSLLLIIISWYFIENFLKHRKTKTLLIAIAFLFLLFGSIHFLLIVNHQLFYVIGNILELIAYALVLSNFFMVLKR